MKIAINSRMTKKQWRLPPHANSYYTRVLFDEVIRRYIKGEYA